MSAKLIKKFKNKQALDHLKRRDANIFAKAYNDYVADIYRFIYFKIGHDEEAKDITSTVFLKTWDHIQSNRLESAKTIRSLLYKVARNTIIDHYRAQASSPQVSLEDERFNFDFAIESDEAERLDLEADIELVLKNLPKLKEEYREVLVLRFIQELELEEIADITGKSRGNIRVLSHRALQALKAIIAQNKNKPKKDN